MQIFITLIPSGRKITAEVEGTDSVEALRRQIHAQVCRSRSRGGIRGAR